MALSAEFVEKVKKANPIDEVMGEKVTIKESNDKFTCLCPFHNEKTPSCFIYPDKGIFHCFGCGKAGDVVTFMSMYNNLSFADAVKVLADRAGLEFPDMNGDPE